MNDDAPFTSTPYRPAGSKSNDAEDAPPWSKPKPLPAGLLPVPPFDLAFLPKSIAPWVADIAERMQCPLDFVAVPAMVALGSVLGRKIAIHPQRKTEWCEVPNLWGLVIGPPGAMKSPAMSEAMKPIRRLEAQARINNEAALAAHEQAVEENKLRREVAAKRAREALKKDAGAAIQLCLDEPKEPKAKRYIVDDATYEKLGEILADNPNGVLAFRDEIVSLLRTLDREEYAAARGFFLAAWGGMSGYTFDRIIRGTVHIEAACVSLLGSTQPGKAAEYVHRALDGGEGDDGMIQRFGLMVWPDQTPEWKEVDQFPNAEAKKKAWAAFDDLDKLDWEKVGALKGQYEPVPYLNFDDEAQALFSAWHRELEMSLRGDELSPALKGHFAKYRKLVPALALVNHLADGGYGDVRAVRAQARHFIFKISRSACAARLLGRLGSGGGGGGGDPVPHPQRPPDGRLLGARRLPRAMVEPRKPGARQCRSRLARRFWLASRKGGQDRRARAAERRLFHQPESGKRAMTFGSFVSDRPMRVCVCDGKKL